MPATLRLTISDYAIRLMLVAAADDEKATQRALSYLTRRGVSYDRIAAVTRDILES